MVRWQVRVEAKISQHTLKPIQDKKKHFKSSFRRKSALCLTWHSDIEGFLYIVRKSEQRGRPMA